MCTPSTTMAAQVVHLPFLYPEMHASHHLEGAPVDCLSFI